MIDQDFSRIQSIHLLREKVTLEETARSKEYSWLSIGHPLGAPPCEIRRAQLDRFVGAKYSCGQAYGPKEFVYCLKYFIGFLQIIEKTPVGISKETLTKLHSLQSLMSGASRIADKLSHLNCYGLPSFCKKLVKQVEKDGQMWIPLSWLNRRKEPQAILVHVDLVGEVRVINSNPYGDSLDRQMIETKEGGDELRYQQCVTIRDIRGDRLLHPRFFQLLCELVTRPSWDKDFSVSEPFIIEPIADYLQGKIELGVDFGACPQLFKKPLRSNFPISKVISTAIDYYLDDVREFKRLKFLWQTQALVGYVGPYDEYMKNLVEDLHRSAAKVDLPSAFRKGFEATAEDLLSRVELGPRLDLEKLKPFTVDKVTQTMLMFQSWYLGSPGDKWSPLAAETAAKKGLLAESVRQEYGNLPACPLKNDGPEIIAYLEKIETITQSYEVDDPSLNNIFFDLLARRVLELPTPRRSASSYWRGLKQPSILPCITIVHGLMRHVVQLADDSYHAKNQLLLFKLFSIVQDLAQGCSELALGVPSFCFEDLWRHRGGLYLLEEAEYQEQAKRLFSFFFRDYKLTSDSYVSEMEKSKALFYFENDWGRPKLRLSNGSRKSRVSVTYILGFLEQILSDPDKRAAFYEKSTYRV